MSTKIHSKPYFWIALGIPLSLSIFSTILIAKHLNLSLCWTKVCLETFIDVFNIPISLLGLTFVSTGAAFAYYRIELSYEQNERQLNQFTQTNYNSFRTEFLALLSEIDYEYKAIDIPSSWLFSTLYPNARSGDQRLNPEFEEFIMYEEHDQGFTGAMNSLSETLASRDGSRYRAGSYLPVSNQFLWLREIITLDADVNLSFVGGASFAGDYAQHTINIASAHP